MELLPLVLVLGLVVLVIASLWKVFEKAGQPGWAALVPIYNAYVLTCKVAQKDVIWFVLFLVPFVNIIVGVLVYIEVANKFGQGALFGLGLAFLGFIFFPILAFGSAEYQGNETRSGGKRRRPVYVEDDKW